MEETTVVETAAAAPGPVASVIALVFVVAILILAVIIWWRIFKKAGYHGAMGLLMFVPVINVIVLLVFAFREWPIQKKLRELGR